MFRKGDLVIKIKDYDDSRYMIEGETYIVKDVIDSGHGKNILVEGRIRNFGIREWWTWPRCIALLVKGICKDCTAMCKVDDKKECSFFSRDEVK